MTVVAAAIEIAVAPEAVWGVIMDPRRLEDWVTIHRRLVDADVGELRPGFAVEQTLALAGAPFTVRWRLAEVDPPRRAVWEGWGPAGSRAWIEDRLEPRAGGRATHFDYRNEYANPGGRLGALAGRLVVGGLAEREAQRSLGKLKALLESG